MIDHSDGEALAQALAQLRQLSAKDEIRDCVHRYARAIDRNDDELLRSAFFDDAVTSHAFYRGNIAGFITWVRERMNSYVATSHCITNHRAEITGDVAHAESYGTIFTKDTDGLTLNIWGIRYLDRLECRAGVWKIAARQFVMDWYSPAVTASDGQPFIDRGGYVLGQQDRSDASYMRPLVPDLSPAA